MSADNPLMLQAEREKLARVLAVPANDLHSLEQLDVRQLRALRNAISAALFDEHADVFKRLGDASKLLPAAIAAKLSAKVFGPLFSARISGLLPVERAIAIARKLDTAFLATLTRELDPRSARPLLKQMPVEITVEVAEALADDEEFVTMARFVDALTPEAIRAVSERLSDEQLLRIGFYVETPESLTQIIADLPEDRIANTVRLTAQGNPDIRAAGLALMAQVDSDAKAILGGHAIALGDEVLAAMVSTASELGAQQVLIDTLQAVAPSQREQAQQWLQKLA